jgi:hypothetical protein
MKSLVFKMMILAVVSISQYAKADYAVIEKSTMTSAGQMIVSVWFPINSTSVSPTASNRLIDQAKALAQAKGCGANYNNSYVKLAEAKNFTNRFDLSSSGIVRYHTFVLNCSYGNDILPMAVQDVLK